MLIKIIEIGTRGQGSHSRLRGYPTGEGGLLVKPKL